MPTSTYPIKIRNRVFYHNLYGRKNTVERREAWRSLKELYASGYPASVIIDDRIASVSAGGLVTLSDKVTEWLTENGFHPVCINQIAMMLGFVDEEDALAFQIRFLG